MEQTLCNAKSTHANNWSWNLKSAARYLNKKSLSVFFKIKRNEE
jgi:hypothetical protein